MEGSLLSKEADCNPANLPQEGSFQRYFYRSSLKLTVIVEVGWNSFAQSDILKPIFVALNIEFVAAFVKSY